MVGMGAAAGVAAVALAVALALTLAVALPGAVTEALAASPSPTLAAVGDPRSSGQGPGLVGDPLTAILLVALIAVAAVAATLAYVRATPGPRRNPGER
jgi:hypothetical protein